jgi:uncharacterized protein YbaP (TraB family)
VRALLWRVEREGRVSYLFGTVHVGVSMREALGPEGVAALARARVVYVEASIDDAATVQDELLSAVIRAQLPEGRSLRAMLGESDFTKLTRVLSTLPAALIDRLSPTLVALLTLGSLQTSGSASAGADAGAGARDASVAQADHQDSGAARPSAPMDLQIAQSARARGADVRTLERLRAQFEAFEQIGVDGATQLIRSFVRDPESSGRLLGQITEAYREPDAERSMSAVVRAMHETSPAFARALLDDRNDRWLPMIDQAMRSQDGVFVAVGAAHMVEAKGLVAGLRARGFTVERVREGE